MGAVPQMDVAELARLRDAGQALAILDVREDWEREICALEPSIAIPLNELPDNLEKLPKDNALVVLCHHGMRSLRAAAWLRSNGFENAVNLAGGIDAWAQQIDRQMKVY
jgi:rhodanese-related sulfurtransferase